MKTKKLIMAVVALTMSTAMAASVSGCTHKHEYTNWTQTKAPTCTEQGEETGTCQKDGATQIRKIDATGHNYGEWQISAPTDTASGMATKICANGTHPLEVELPVLTSEKYTISEKSPAGVTKGGINTYTLKHSEGDISFSVKTNAKGVHDFGDVVMAAVENKDKVRSGIVKVPGVVQGDYTYEYGDNYVHVNQLVVVNGMGGISYAGSEYFIDTDSNGNVVYAVIAEVGENGFEKVGNEYKILRKDVKLPVSFSELDSVETFKNGFPVNISNTVYAYQTDANAADYYEKNFSSVEYYLQWLYEISQTKANGSVTTNFNLETGVCKLQFSYLGTTLVEKLGPDGRKVYEITNRDPNGDGIDYDAYGPDVENPDLPLLQYNDTPVFEEVPALVTVDIDFTVDENYVLTSISSTIKNYAERTLKVADDQSAEIPEYPCKYPDARIYEIVPYFTFNGGEYVLTQDAVINGSSTYSATQVAKTEQDTVPENVYAQSKVGVKDFEFYDSKYDWTGQYSLQTEDGEPAKIYDWIKNEKITDPTGVGITVTTNADPLKIFIDEVKPETAIANLNKCTLVLKDGTGKSKVLQKTGSYDEVFGWYDANESVVYVKNYSNLGEYTLDVTLGEVTKSLKIKFEAMAPTSFVAKMNSYDETTAEYTVTNANEASIFVNEELTLFVEASGDAHCATDLGYSAIVKASNGAVLDTAKYTVKTEVVDGVTRYTFTFLETGEYTVTLKADKGDLSRDVAINVSAVPTLEEILTGNLQHKASGTVVTFNQAEKIVNVTVDGKTAAFTYEYDANTKLFALNHTGGSVELNGTVAMQINLKNHVVLTYSYNVPEPLVYVLTVPSGNPVDEAYEAITSTPWKLESQYLTFTFSKDGSVIASSPMSGTETWNYALSDNGDGTFNLSFSGDDMGYCGIWPDDNGEGSKIKVENGVVTEFHFLYADGWGGTTEYTLTAAI